MAKKRGRKKKTFCVLHADRECKICKKVLPITDFYTSVNIEGHQYECKKCNKILAGNRQCRRNAEKATMEELKEDIKRQKEILSIKENVLKEKQKEAQDDTTRR